MPTLDVVVPCYKYGHFLERCVRSALDQEGADVRVLIIDDCSPDDSAAVGERLASADPRVEFRRHEKNQGHIATYNEGLIGWAKSDYCLLLSADDALAPGAFKRALKLFEASPDVGLVFGKARIITHDSEFEFPADNDFTSTQIMSGHDFLRYCCELGGNPVPTPAVIVRTAMQQRLGGYRSDLPHTGDVEMWLRFARHGSIGIVQSVQAEYRRHASNMSRQYYKQVLSDKVELESAFIEALKPILAENPNARRWLESMHSILLSQAHTNAVIAFDSGETEAYRAWLAFAKKISAAMINPRRSMRLELRKLVGRSAWLRIRRARKLINPRLPDPATSNMIWSPAHGDIIGEWPSQN